MGQLHHALAQVGLDHLHAQVFEVVVEPDLLAGHRLALGHDHSPPRGKLATRVPADLADDVARLGGVLGQMYDSADRGESLRELVQQLRQTVEVGEAATFQLGPAPGEIETFEGLVPAPTQSDHGVGQRFLQDGVVESSVDAAPEMAARLRHAFSKLPGSLPSRLPVLPPAPSIWSRRKRRRADRRRGGSPHMDARREQPAQALGSSSSL